MYLTGAKLIVSKIETLVAKKVRLGGCKMIWSVHNRGQGWSSFSLREI